MPGPRLKLRFKSELAQSDSIRSEVTRLVARDTLSDQMVQLKLYHLDPLIVLSLIPRDRLAACSL